MSDIYDQLAAACCRIADSFPQPRFYKDCRKELDVCRKLFRTDKTVLRCLEMISDRLHDNYGHGLDHATKVGLEAGALALRERTRLGLCDSSTHRIAVLALLSGLLHDICRGEKEHARRGALAAGPILDLLPVTTTEKTCITGAIANHEAFVEPSSAPSIYAQTLSDTLYDADKFRWGPDNFTVTLWEMLRSRPIPMAVVIRRYPEGMEGIARIKDTFRSEAGKSFGPEFIDLGLKIGNETYEFLKKRGAEEQLLS
jgi:hypothetical protein